MGYEERKQERIERLKERAEKHRANGQSRFKEANRIASFIEPGQPILVGHHSERRHRRDLERIDNNMRKGVEALNYSEELERRADVAESNGAISSQDENAIPKLKAELEEKQAKQEFMKRVNSVFRKTRTKLKKQGVTSTGNEFTADILRDMIAGEEFTEAEKKRIVEDAPYQSYSLTNNNANIKRIKDRITGLERVDARQAESEDYEIELSDGSTVQVEFNADRRGIELHFDGKPSEEIRTLIKEHRYKWSGRQKMWYARDNNLTRAALKHLAEK